MVVRVSRRFGPFRLSAFEGGRAYGGTYRYDEVDDVLDAFQPNWPKRIAIVAGAMTPGWVAFGLGWPLLAFVFVLGAGLALISAIKRTELAYGCSSHQFGAWCGAITAGSSLAVLLGMLAGTVSGAV